MVIYPIPVEVTQARVQLVVDQAAKAPPHTINQDLQAVDHAKAAAIDSGPCQSAGRRTAPGGRQGLT